MYWVRPDRIVRTWRGQWGLRKTLEAVAIGFILVAAACLLSTVGRKRSTDLVQRSNGCQFPAIFNFGDSNSDTGSVEATFHSSPLPNGVTFFGKATGRHSDGRLIIDFLAEKLGLPYLNAYLDSIGTNFRYGANFAASGSTIQPLNAKIYKAGANPLSLDIQLYQFERFKARTIELFNQDKMSSLKMGLPRPEDFSKALYTIDIGQNDLHGGITSMTEEQVQLSIPRIINLFASVIEKLYRQGARTFWIQNTGPIGCLPYFIIKYPPKPGNADQNGCVKSYNKLAQEFNKQLKDRVYQLRAKYANAFLVYVDVYSAKYSMISRAKKNGFINPLGYCCGHLGDFRVKCGRTTILNGSKVFGDSCTDPLKYISWDGIHYTEAASRSVATQILDGLLSDPQVPITEACLNSVHSR
ncbi:Alpha-L-fucosidase [Bertholletia excelsa]